MISGRAQGCDLRHRLSHLLPGLLAAMGQFIRVLPAPRVEVEFLAAA